MAAMLGYECLHCCWVNYHMLDETIVVEHMEMGILKHKKVMANLRLTSSYIWRPCWFSIFCGRSEYFTILFEILTDESVGIDTHKKSLDSLIRNIFVIE